MEHYKSQNKRNSGLYRPYGGRVSSCTLTIKIPKERGEDEEDPVTPGSIASAWPGWYKFPFPYIEPEKEILYFD